MIDLKTFLSQIYTLKIKMTKIDLNILSKEVNIHLYPQGYLIQTLVFRVKGYSLGFRVKGWGLGLRA